MDIMLQRIVSLIPQKPDGNFVHGAKKAFADSLGLPSNIVAEWIAGRNKSYQRHIHAISNIYGVSVEWLEGKTDTKEKNVAVSSDGRNDQENKFLKYFRLMSEDEQNFLLAQMQGATADRE